MASSNAISSNSSSSHPGSSAAGKPRVGMIGLAVMGSNLARNIERNGYPCAVHNRDNKVLNEFMSKYGAGKFIPGKTIAEFVQVMESPRQIFLMIKAGSAVDQVIDQLIPHLAQGDIIIDGGNSFFKDTLRREKYCAERGIRFVGIGISGGEEGALNGPSLMPGGPQEGWKILQPVLEKISAKVEGHPCTSYVGPDGAGHFVKMVHNGIEYGDMQLIAEAYDILRKGLGCRPPELAEIFSRWNEGPLSSFLIEITGQIFKREEGSDFLIDKILDKAGQKGTGMWTAQVALDLGVAIPTLAAAVECRFLSALKDERVAAAARFEPPQDVSTISDRAAFVELVHDALYCSKIISYAQGMALIGRASKEYKWEIKLDEVAALWRGGCIIRARFLDTIRKAYRETPELPNLVLHPEIQRELTRCTPALRKVIGLCAERGIPSLAFSSALGYFDSYSCANMPQNLTQAQRDYFGAHTYQRVDREGVFHTEWS